MDINTYKYINKCLFELENGKKTSRFCTRTEKAVAERQPLYRFYKSFFLRSRILDVCLCCLFGDTGHARVARLSALLSPQAIPHSIRKKRSPNGNRFIVFINRFSYALGFLMFACAAFLRYGTCPCRSPFGSFIATSNSAFDTGKAAAERQPLYRFYKSFFLRSRILDVCLCCRKTCDRHSER